jgi:hypothetical protein
VPDPIFVLYIWGAPTLWGIRIGVPESYRIWWLTPVPSAEVPIVTGKADRKIGLTSGLADRNEVRRQALGSEMR